MIKLIQAPLLGPPFLGALHRIIRDASLRDLYRTLRGRIRFTSLLSDAVAAKTGYSACHA